MGPQGFTDLVNLDGDVARPGSRTVGRGVFVQVDEVCVCSTNRVVYQRCDGAQAVGFVATMKLLTFCVMAQNLSILIAQAMPDNQWQIRCRCIRFC